MAPKRKERSARDVPSSSSSRNQWRDDDYPQIQFEDQQQWDRFLKLKVRKIKASRFFDHELLRSLGLNGQLQAFFHSLRLDVLFDMHHGTYPNVVLEILSSFQKREDRVGRVLGFRFRFRNRTYTWDMEEFREAFGIPVVGTEFAPGTQNAFPLWHKLTGMPNMDPSHLTISAVQHPVLRLTLKLFATTLFGRADNSLSRMNELQFLGPVLTPNAPQDFQDFAVAMVHHLSYVSTAAKSAPIWVGGVLTHLAVHHGLEEPAELPADTLLSHVYLRNAGYMGPLSSQIWYYGPPGGPQLSLSLPTQNLPPVTPNANSYLLPMEQHVGMEEEEEAEYEEDDDEDDDAGEGDAAQPSVPHAAGYPYPDFQQNMQQIMGSLTTQTELLQGLTTRVNTLQLGQDDLNNQVNTLRLGQYDLNERVARMEDENRRNWDRFFGGGWNQWQGGPGSGSGGQ